MSTILFAALFLALLAFMVWVTPKTNEQERDKLLAVFRRRFGHLPVDEQIDLRIYLTRFARLRRRATEAVLRDPLNAGAIIERIALEEAGTVPTEIKTFMEVVQGSRQSEILYPEAQAAAFRAAREYAKNHPVPAAIADEIASLRVL